MLRRLGTTALLSLTLLLPAAAASAQEGYPGGETEVLSENLQAPTPGAAGAGAGGVGGAGVTAGRGAGNGAVRGSGLAVTGSDMAQLAGIGIVLLAGGTVLVRRSRRTAPQAA